MCIRDRESSKINSFETFKAFLGRPTGREYREVVEDLKRTLQATILELTNNEDSTKVTEKGIDDLKKLQRKLQINDSLEWFEWVKMSKIKVGAKSKESLLPLQDLARTHDSFTGFIRIFSNSFMGYLTLLLKQSMNTMLIKNDEA